MTPEIEQINHVLKSLQTEVSEIKKNYLILNETHSKTLISLKELTLLSSEAAKRSAAAAEKASEATVSSVKAAKAAANESLISIADSAADFARAAAEAAMEAAYCAASAAAAAHAVRMSHVAAQYARDAHRPKK